MNDISRLHRIINSQLAVELSKCEPVENLRKNNSAGLSFVDVQVAWICVDDSIATSFRDELCEIFKHILPSDKEKISSTQVGRILGDQDEALQVLAVGKVLGFWELEIPSDWGIKGAAADNFARSGQITIHDLQLVA